MDELGRNKDISRRLVEAFHLEAEPVAVSYTDEPRPGADDRKRYVCVAIRHAFRGDTLILSRKTLTCLGGVHWLGFMQLEELIVAFLVMLERSFKDSDVARHWFHSSPTPPLDRGQYVVLEPLGKCGGEPDLVAFKLDPSRAEAMIRALTFSRGDFSIEHRFSATCQGVITNPLVTGKPFMCLPDLLSRKFAGFDEGEIFLSMPVSYVEEILSNYPEWKVDANELFRVVVEMTKTYGKHPE